MRQQGGLLSTAGMRMYIRSPLHHAGAITEQLHDLRVCPLAQTVVLFDAARELEMYLGLEQGSCAD